VLGVLCERKIILETRKPPILPKTGKNPLKTAFLRFFVDYRGRRLFFVVIRLDRLWVLKKTAFTH